MSDDKPGKGFTRRGFIASLGAGVLGTSVGVGAGAGAPPAGESRAPAERLELSLTVNGRSRQVLVEARQTLLGVLRDTFGLTAAKIGCGRGECGACTVLIGDRTRYACMTLAVEAEGAEVVTLEGLMQGEELGPVQKAFAELDGYQCGYCTPGQIVAVEGLLRRNPNPSLDEIRLAVSGNLCRCGAYRNIFRAAGRAAELRRA